MKIYLIFMRNNGGLYAWTTKRLFLEQFLIARSKRQFKYKKVDFGFDGFSKFLGMNSDKELTTIYLYDGSTEYGLIGTNKEDRQLSTAVDMIQDRVTESTRILNSMISPEEMSKILELVTLSNNEQLTINSFKLFYQLFEYTFDPRADIVPFEQQLDLVMGQVEC